MYSAGANGRNVPRGTPANGGICEKNSRTSKCTRSTRFFSLRYRDCPAILQDLLAPSLPPAALSEARLAAGCAIFLASYIVFAIGKFPGLKIDRTGAAIIGAVGMVAFRIVPPREAVQFIDFGTIVLLFSMMLIVGNLHLVGFFECSAEVVLRRIRPGHLLPAVIFTCGFLSAFFVNDIVCLVMVPFVLSITRRMKLVPLLYLLAVATASNIGSVSTMTGNPQNMLIGSFSGIKYRDLVKQFRHYAVDSSLNKNQGVPEGEP